MCAGSHTPEMLWVLPFGCVQLSLPSVRQQTGSVALHANDEEDAASIMTGKGENDFVGVDFLHILSLRTRSEPPALPQ